MPDKSTAATLNSVIKFLHFLHKVVDYILCKVKTSDYPTDTSILFDVSGPAVGKVEALLRSKSLNLIGNMRQKFVVVQFLSFLGFWFDLCAICMAI